jgi:hypothetical protein
MDIGELLVQVAMRHRSDRGLKLTWYIPEQDREFTAFPATHTQKDAWIADGHSKGWELLTNND